MAKNHFPAAAWKIRPYRGTPRLALNPGVMPCARMSDDELDMVRATPQTMPGSFIVTDAMAHSTAAFARTLCTHPPQPPPPGELAAEGAEAPLLPPGTAPWVRPGPGPGPGPGAFSPHVGGGAGRGAGAGALSALSATAHMLVAAASQSVMASHSFAASQGQGQSRTGGAAIPVPVPVPAPVSAASAASAVGADEIHI